MHRSEFVIAIILRILGVGGLLAIPAILLPFEWMDSIHNFAGLGTLPDAPIVRYLSRSLSAFYAMFGSITLLMSFDIRRYRPLVGLWSILFLTFGIVILGIDITSKMPLHWTLTEGPPAIVVGIAVLWLQRSISRSD